MSDRSPGWAWAEWQRRLAAYEPPPIDRGLVEAIDDYVNRRSAELGDANLYG